MPLQSQRAHFDSVSNAANVKIQATKKTIGINSKYDFLTSARWNHSINNKDFLVLPIWRYGRRISNPCWEIGGKKLPTNFEDGESCFSSLNWTHSMDGLSRNISNKIFLLDASPSAKFGLFLRGGRKYTNWFHSWPLSSPSSECGRFLLIIQLTN